MTAGRPSGYSEEIADEICRRLADGQSLKSICSSDDMPCTTSVFKWLGQHPEFADRYARAREAQADALVDEMLDIADDGRNDWMEARDKDGANIGWRENGEALRRSQLRLEARKWIAAKMKPKKYSDRQTHDHQSSDGSMTPKPSFDPKALSDGALREFIEAFKAANETD